MSQILKLKPQFLKKIWGSHRLQNWGYDINNETNMGEAWVISALDSNPTAIINGSFQGLTLKEFYERNKNLFNLTYNEFPLLSKIITSDDYLSVQVHPNDEYAKTHHQSLGKAECWYILDCPKDAKIIYGHNANDNQQLTTMINEKQWKHFLKEVAIVPGDFLYVPPGKVHAITPKVTIFELQQSSDITYRLYDFDRKDDEGNLRALHLKDSLATITVPDTNLDVIHRENGLLVNNEYFSLHLINNSLPTTYDFNETKWLQLTVVSGAGTINDEPFKMGESAIILDDKIMQLTITGTIKLLVSYCK